MKCLFCGSELVLGKAEGVAKCPACNMWLYMKTRNVIAGGDAPGWLTESFACLQFIRRYHPDVALSATPIFDKNFTRNDALFIFNNKRDMSALPERFRSAVFYPGMDVSEYTHCIALKGVLTYKFKDMFQCSLDSAPKCSVVPLLDLFRVPVERYMWHLLLSVNVQAEKVDYHSSSVLLSPIPTAEMGLSDTQAAVSAAFLKDTRFKEIGCVDGDWAGAANAYFKSLAPISDNSVAKQSELFAKCEVKDQQGTFWKNLVTQYAHSTPQLYLTNSMGDTSLFDAECPDGVDSTPIDIFLSEHSGTVFQQEFGRYQVYEFILRNAGFMSGSLKGVTQ